MTWFFILKPKESASVILEKVEQFLAKRGMNVSQRKTKVTASTDGFDFLGWNFYVQRQNGKFRCVPSVENFKAFREKVKKIVNSSNYGAETKVAKLAPIVQGWRAARRRSLRTINTAKMDGSVVQSMGLKPQNIQSVLKTKNHKPTSS